MYIISIFDVILRNTEIYNGEINNPACDQYWSRDDLVTNIRLIIDVPQYIERTSRVACFIRDKIVGYVYNDIDSHRDPF